MATPARLESDNAHHRRHESKRGRRKTTTAVNLSAALARAGQSVCLIDMDPQAHASLHVGATPGEELSMYDVLTGDTTLAEARKQVDENLWVIGSHIDLAAAEVELVGVVGREVILRDKLAEDTRADGAPEFDYLIIDCPPSLGVLTLNALAAADEVFAPAATALPGAAWVEQVAPDDRTRQQADQRPADAGRSGAVLVRRRDAPGERSQRRCRKLLPSPAEPSPQLGERGDLSDPHPP